MSDGLPVLVDGYLASLARENASAHTIRNYGVDLNAWVAFLTPPDGEPPLVTELDVLTMREWLASLYDKELETSSVRRKLAAVRSFLKWAERQGLVQRNVARLVRTPKMIQRLPAVPSPETASHLLDSVKEQAAETDRPHPARDLAIFELLYGCGLRVSELVGLNLRDIDLNERWMRVRGKGRKEREVPYGERAADALLRWLEARSPSDPAEVAVFLNHHGRRLTDRSVRRVVRFYSDQVLGDSSIHPHTFRHAYATHMLASGADLRAIQELLGHARLSTTQKYTQVALSDLMRVYDKCHPRA
ncbi:MAG: tyrosine-type recombinase/integrase [Bryobacteraceae bacterium]|nr:tyrosine-type recombinase/integrase [Bryobacteraceae bacterium]